MSLQIPRIAADQPTPWTGIAEHINFYAAMNLKQQGIDIEELLSELTGDEDGPLVQVDEEGKSVFISVE